MSIDDFDTQIQIDELIPEWYEDYEKYLQELSDCERD